LLQFRHPEEQDEEDDEGDITLQDGPNEMPNGKI